MRIKISYPAILSIIFLCCGNDNPTESTINSFTGITQTDSIGNVIQIDTDDWNSILPPTPGYPEVLRVGPAYPNPCSDTITIPIVLPKKLKANLCVINDKKDTIIDLANEDILTAGKYMYMWSLRDFQNQKVEKGMYRCLYEISEIDSPKVLLFGHGDIKID